jgi:hypothetical protein
MLDTRVWRCTLLILCLSVCRVGAQPPTRVTLFIGPQVRDGFVDVDQGVLDSINDVKNALRGVSSIALVMGKDSAQMTLEVLSRGATSDTGGGAVAVPVGTLSFLLPVGTIGLTTVLHVGTYETPIVMTNCQEWRHCAKLVAKDIETWVTANRDALAHRESSARHTVIQ